MNLILVLDEVHNLVGAGDAEGSMIAANILKPALSRGDVQVVGVPDERFGDGGGAFIMLHDDADLTEDKVRDLCRQKMARYKCPKYVFFVDNFPQTASGKIQKYRLREMATDMVGAQTQQPELKDATAQPRRTGAANTNGGAGKYPAPCFFARKPLGAPQSVGQALLPVKRTSDRQECLFYREQSRYTSPFLAASPYSGDISRSR